MSVDKRRRARVQGGWATVPSARPNSAGCSSDGKPKVQKSPAWLAKTVDHPSPRGAFVFEAPSEKIREKPKEQIYAKGGVYDISHVKTEPDSICRLKYFPDFIEVSEADLLYDQMYHEFPWKQRSDVRDGVQYLQPRLTAWFGDLPYSYSGVTLAPNTDWLPFLKKVKDKLEESTGYTFNSMLANLYRNGHDSVDWHSDDEPSLGKNPIIASLSFGDTRNFELRRKPPPEEHGSYEYMEHIKIPLTHGSLLIMEGAVQDQWQHRVPKEYHDRGGRINLTFRTIYPERQPLPKIKDYVPAREQRKLHDNLDGTN